MSDSNQTSTLRIVVDPSGAKSGSEQVAQSISKITDEAKKSGNSIDGFLNKIAANSLKIQSFLTSALTKFLQTVTVALAASIYAMDKMLDRMMDVNITYNAFIATMTMVKGSVAAATQEFKYITDYSNKMGASVEDNAKVYIRLAAALKEVDKSGGAARHVFEAVSQAQAVLHLKGYETNGVFLAMEQIISKGKLSLEEIQKQLGNRLPEAMGISARSMGMTQAQFRKEITAGSIEPLQFVLKLANQIKMEYGDAAKHAADMFNGQVMRMKNAIFGLYLSVGQNGAMDGLTKIVQSLTNLMSDPDVGKQFGESLNEVFSSIAEWISSITASDIKDFFDSLGATAKTFKNLIGDLGDAFSSTASTGNTTMLDFMDSFSGALIIVTDMVMTLVATLASIPVAIYSIFKDIEVGLKRMEVFRSDNYKDELAQLIVERDDASKRSDSMDAILFATGDSPTVKAMKAKTALFDGLRKRKQEEQFKIFDAQFSPQPAAADSPFMSFRPKSYLMNPLFGADTVSPLFKNQNPTGKEAGSVLTHNELDTLASGGPKAPGSTRGTGVGRKKALSDEETAYKSLMKTVDSRLAQSSAELLMGADLSETQKMTVSLNEIVRKSNGKITSSQEDLIASKIEMIRLNTSDFEWSKKTSDENFKFSESLDTTTSSLREKLRAQNDYNATIGLSAQALADLEVAKLEENASAKEGIATLMDEIDWSGQLGDKYREQAKLLRELGKAKKDGVAKDFKNEEIEKAKKDLDSFLDPTKAQSFGDALKGAFGGAGDALSKLTSALQVYGIKEAEIAKAKKDAILEANGDASKLAARTVEISKKELEYRLGSYGDMAGAAAEFFDKESKGYAVLSGVSKAFHLAEMALQLASIGPKLAAGAATMFGQSGWGGFAGVAAMGLVMAGLGYNSSTSAGGVSAESMQKSQGTGSVFGDAEAKSDSISKSIEDMTRNSDRLLPINVGMLTALKSIESSMVGFTNLIIQDAGIVNGGNFNVQEGTLARSTQFSVAGGAAVGGAASGAYLGSMVGAFLGPVGAILGAGLGAVAGALAAKVASLWGKTTQKVVDSGVSFGGKVSDLQEGQGFNQYASVDTTKSSWFGLKKNTTNSVLQQSMSSEISAQFGMIFKSMGDALSEANNILGGNAETFKSNLENLVLSTESISLKGLSGQDLSDAINNVISKSLDEMAKAVLPQFEKFREVGEGYAQTVMRVTNTFGTVNQIFKEIGLTLYEVSDAGVAASMSFTGLMGDLSTLQSVAQSYYENFFSEEERNANILKALTDEFEKQNFVLPKTRAEYRNLVEDISANGTQEQLSMLLKLSNSFAQIVPENAAAAVSGVVDANLERLKVDSKMAAAAREVTQAMELQVLAAKDLARVTAQTAYDSTLQTRLRAGKTSEILNDSLSLAELNPATYMKDGQFVAAAFNSQIIRKRAKDAMLLADKASLDAINVEDISSVLTNLFAFTKDSEFKNELRRDLNLNSGFVKDVGYVMYDFIEESINGIRLQNYTSRGAGITSVLAAAEDIGYQGELLSAYQRSLNMANGGLRLGIITQEEYANGILRANEILEDHLQPMEKLQEAYRKAGIDSIAFYFNQIGESVKSLADAAESANEPLQIVSASIGRFKSISYVLETSAIAAGGDANAELVAQLAKKAADAITTSDASVAAKALANQSSFTGVDGSSLRNISLLLDGVREFDAQSFENAFLRITDALNKGVISQAQYASMFNQGMNTFSGLDDVTKELTDNMVNLRNSMKDFADGLLIDKSKTTLSLKSTQDELMRQYEVSKVGAMTGDSESVNKYFDLANKLTDISRYSDRAQYNAVFGKVYGDARNVEKLAESIINQNSDRVATEIVELRKAIIQEVMPALVKIAKNTKDTTEKLEAM